MADEIEFSPDELEQIKELLGPLDEADMSSVFHIMKDHFDADIKELTPEPEIDLKEGEDTPPDPDLMDSDFADDTDGSETSTDDGIGDPGEPGDLGGDAPADDAMSDLGDLGDPGGDAPADDAMSDLGDLGDPGGDAPADDAMSDLGDLGDPGGDAPADDVMGDLGDLDDPGGDDPADDAIGDLGDLGDLGGNAAADDAMGDLGDLGDLGGDTAADDAMGDLGDLGDLGGDAAADDAMGDLGDLGDLGGDTAADDAMGDLGDLGDLGGDAAADDAMGDLGDLGDLGDDSAADDAMGDLGDLGDLGGDAAADDAMGDLGDLGDLGGDAPADDAMGDLGDLGDFDDLGDSATSDSDDGLGDFADIEADVTASPVATDSSADSELLGADDDLGDLNFDAADLQEMSDSAKMDSGIGDEFSDEDLANIRQALLDYPPGIKKSVIDIVINEKVSQPDQRLLMNMVIDQSDSDLIADFIEARLGYRPETAPSNVTREGVQIIYADDLNPEALAAKRKKNKILMIGAAAAGVAVAAILGTFTLISILNVRGKYEAGLEELYAARKSLSAATREQHKKKAEEFFNAALAADDGQYNVEYLNKYGIAYMKAGYFEEAFIKLFGKVEPEYGNIKPELAWATPGKRAPLIQLAQNSSWPDMEERKAGKQSILTQKNGIKRRVIIPGAYIVDRLRDKQFNHTSIINLSRFHSNPAVKFSKSRFKNNDLAIDYNRIILTIMNRPNDLDAITGIGDVYYNQKLYGKAARYYNQSIEKHPMKVRGHSGLLTTYIEIWKTNDDPRMVIAKHRNIRNLGLEEDLPIYLTAKLAGFYIDIDEDNLRIKYQIDPVDALSDLDLRDNAAHLLEIVFKKEETRDGETIVGSRYGEGYYQRGRFLMTQKEPLRAVRQFQNAHNYDPLHYLAINEIGEYYMNRRDFDKAAEYFQTSIRSALSFYPLAGNRPEDETLINGEIGKIYYNLGALSYLRYAGFDAKSKLGFPDTQIYPNHQNEPETDQTKKRRENLARSREYLIEAANHGIKDTKINTNLIYWMGWIDYINSDFESALKTWEKIDPLYSDADPVLLMARGNSYFYTNQLRAALGNYLKVESDYQKKIASIPNPDSTNNEHRYFALALAAVHNNIGAVYEKEYSELNLRGGNEIELKELEKNALLHYYKAVDISRQMDKDNEVARSNLQLAFKYNFESQKEPILDDWISPVLDSLREEY